MIEEVEVSLVPSHDILPPTPTPEPELKPEPVLESEPESISEPESELVVEVKPVSKVKAKPKAKPKSKTKVVSKPESVPEAEPKLTPAALDITAGELLSAYETGGVAADVKFVNKILNVTGVVDRIEVKDNLDICYITLKSAEENRLQNVRCVFDEEYGSGLNQLTTGQTVTVQGKYDGSIMDICMRDCVLLR
jgi:hypothetical protein